MSWLKQVLMVRGVASMLLASGAVALLLGSVGCGRTCDSGDRACREKRCQAGDASTECRDLARSLYLGQDGLAKDARAAYAIAAKACDEDKAGEWLENCELASEMLTSGAVVLAPLDCGPSGPRRHRDKACRHRHFELCASVAREPPEPRCPGPTEEEAANAWASIERGCDAGLYPACVQHVRWMRTTRAAWTPDLERWAIDACRSDRQRDACLAVAVHNPDEVPGSEEVEKKFFPGACPVDDEFEAKACEALHKLADHERSEDARYADMAQRRQALQRAELNRRREIQDRLDTQERDRAAASERAAAAQRAAAGQAAPVQHEIRAPEKKPYTCQKDRCVDMGTDGRCRRSETFADTCYW